MHGHSNQINLSTQLDALYATEKAAATRQAERTRKRLLESASKLAGESDSEEGCVVKLGAHEESQEQAKQQNQQNQASRKKPKEPMDSKRANSSVSAWA
jgi:hypothetical protein